MENLKSLTEIVQPDCRSTSWVKLNRRQGTSESIMLRDYYVIVEYAQLHDGVPQDVRNYMDAVRNLYIYGWFYYPFYTLSAFLGTTSVEMALRARLSKKCKDRRGLGKLLKQAIGAGLLKDENFPSLRSAYARKAEIAEVIRQITGHAVKVPEGPYYEEVAAQLIKTRNKFAHPEAQWLMVPGKAIDIFILAADVINQLWARKATQSGTSADPI